MKYNKRKYALYFTGLILLVLISVWAPQILFQIQDSYSMERTRQETRNSLDFENLNYTYEESLRERMYRFAKGIAEGKQFNIAFTEYQVTQEIQDMGEKVCEDSLITILEDIGNVSESAMNEIQTVECKKYVIYEGDFKNGAAFIVWYMKLEMPDGITMKILMDISSDTVYYVQLINQKETGSAENVRTYSEVWFAYSEMLGGLPEYFYDYYAADFNEDFQEKISKKGWLFVEWQLLYQQYKLNFWISQEEDGMLSAGILQIGELIPEMLQE